MSWFKTEVKETTVPSVVPLEKPKASVPELELSEMESQEYLRVAAKLHLNSAVTGRAEILSVLRSLEIPVFPYSEVREYMNNLFKTTERSWFWRPLRAEDVGRSGLQEWRKAPAPEKNGESTLTKHYSKTVPLPVLITAERIAERIPNVGFFVSDALEKGDVKDPFLAISLPGLEEMVVVEVWDEPGFKR